MHSIRQNQSVHRHLSYSKPTSYHWAILSQSYADDCYRDRCPFQKRTLRRKGYFQQIILELAHKFGVFQNLKVGFGMDIDF